MRNEPTPTPARATQLPPVPRWLLTALGTLRKILQLQAFEQLSDPDAPTHTGAYSQEHPEIR